MTTKEIPVLLLTGYLGSGKTTLVNHILSNKQGIKFAVIVNDIGEVNIDADLIQKGGIVGKKDESLVALQNGCICCTLKMDLIEQIGEILRMERFDYIVIEASGICEPEPIAQTICSIPRMGGMYTKYGVCRLDCITTVVDALRLQSEFSCGNDLTRKGIDDEDIENLIIQQIEFCNIILLNKVAEVKPEELKRIRQIIHTLQPGAEIIECNYADVDLKKIIHTGMFNFEHVATSAGWIRGIESQVTEEEEKEAHRHHNHKEDEHQHEGHEHHHEEGEAEEYGISTFVYYRRPAFDIHKFDHFIATKWSRHIIRTKGVCYFSHNRDMSYLFEQAGTQKQLTEAGLWYATAPEEDLIELIRQEPGLLRDWDEKYGDRMQKIVFIGQYMDKEQIIRDLDECLEE
ncbi:GTP-binding protein [Bacteroides eggerthii]|uniref:GTP-binding protein n=1 Tax=Bacteroides eggerthii TaxID=28111 RepID=UPI001C3793C3|nr:GTP-binding protein [Bacteroides eggerthii]MBV3843925.1 GTP-binding protein [Bacteroides eggerthii]MBV3846845.1 GTP-binding protein [Bacteroides eggerthii]MBV3885021.1 GTP-binding protein [Bacteroides eggerthii]MBV3891968.1 GTP-binding protein [Bacteroides eggerthii]MBV3903130.1 GTP-binding protein [Bacteroides eggerthii]